MTQCVLIASWASFVVGVVMTTTSFGPLLYPSGQPKVIIVIFQVIIWSASPREWFSKIVYMYLSILLGSTQKKCT